MRPPWRHRGSETGSGPDDRVWEIKPFEAFGPIPFGITRDEVEAILGPPDTPPPEGTVGLVPKEHRNFGYVREHGVRVDFDRKNGGVCFVEYYTRPPLHGICVAGIVLTRHLKDCEKDYEKSVKVLTRAGYETYFPEPSSVDFPALGVSLWSGDRGLDTVSGWNRGYRDR